MPIEHTITVVPVADLGEAEAFYAALLGRPADNRPTPALVQWRLTDSGWVQLVEDPARAGAAQLNLAVDDLVATKDELVGRGLEPAETQAVSKGVELSALHDPSGNMITLIGNFGVLLA